MVAVGWYAQWVVRCRWVLLPCISEECLVARYVGRSQGKERDRRIIAMWNDNIYSSSQRNTAENGPVAIWWSDGVALSEIFELFPLFDEMADSISDF